MLNKIVVLNISNIFLYNFKLKCKLTVILSTLLKILKIY